jgi:hypothetical protein
MREWLTALGRRVLAFERREVRAFRRWIETTSNLVHVTILVALPLLLGVVTAVSNRLDLLPYLLFPPLASGSYALFSDPEGRHASPRRFVGGLTAGALCGWLALLGATALGRVPTGAYQVDPLAVSVGLFMTGAVTWALDIEEASAFATALLVHVTGADQFAYVLSVAVSSAFVAGAFLAWREFVYEERAEYLYDSIKGDDHVLVPMLGERPQATAMLGARLAAAHDAGKVVLLDVVSDDELAERERELLAADDYGRDHLTTDATGDEVLDDLIGGAVGERGAPADAVAGLEVQADWIETTVGVPCDVVVAVSRGSLARTVQQVADSANCDLIATPYEADGDGLATHVRNLFDGETDVLVHRSHEGRTEWDRTMVPVRRASDVAHSMIEFATRLAGTDGLVSVCHCIDSDGQRRPAEEMLADLVETFEGPLETRVSTLPIQRFVARNAPEYDLVILGASRDRSRASRLVAPPTFERLAEVETDVAIVDRRY